MLKNIFKIKGTALITALMVMGVLTAISLAVSALIIRELGITRLAVDYGRAYYAAESGVELSLLKMKGSLAGVNVLETGFNLTGGGDGNFSVSSTSKTYPYFDETYTSSDPAAYYLPLDVGQSVTIPLFTDGSDGEGVTEFVVQYYANFTSDDFKISGTGGFDINGWDVLRWKIYGIKMVVGTGEQLTESINDFTGVATLSQTDEQTGASIPTWFGSVDNCNQNKDTALIQCVPFKKTEDPKSVSVDGQSVFKGECLPSEAREHYLYDDTGKEIQSVIPCYSINTFLTGHMYNYLTLTNMMNPAVLKDPSRGVRFQKSRLYFRVIVYDKDKELPREYAEITSTGQSGDSVVKLDVLKKRDSYLSVFNFALYHTSDEDQ